MPSGKRAYLVVSLTSLAEGIFLASLQAAFSLQPPASSLQPSQKIDGKFFLALRVNMPVAKVIKRLPKVASHPAPLDGRAPNSKLIRKLPLPLELCDIIEEFVLEKPAPELPFLCMIGECMRPCSVDGCCNYVEYVDAND